MCPVQDTVVAIGKGGTVLSVANVSSELYSDQEFSMDPKQVRVISMNIQQQIEMQSFHDGMDTRSQHSLCQLQSPIYNTLAIYDLLSMHACLNMAVS